MEFTAATIAGFLKGEIEGNADIKVNTIAKIEEGQIGALSFLANPKYEHYLYITKILGFFYRKFDILFLSLIILLRMGDANDKKNGRFVICCIYDYSVCCDITSIKNS